MSSVIVPYLRTEIIAIYQKPRFTLFFAYSGGILNTDRCVKLNQPIRNQSLIIPHTLLLKFEKMTLLDVPKIRFFQDSRIGVNNFVIKTYSFEIFLSSKMFFSRNLKTRFKEYG